MAAPSHGLAHDQGNQLRPARGGKATPDFCLKIYRYDMYLNIHTPQLPRANLERPLHCGGAGADGKATAYRETETAPINICSRPSVCRSQADARSPCWAAPRRHSSTRLKRRSEHRLPDPKDFNWPYGRCRRNAPDAGRYLVTISTKCLCDWSRIECSMRRAKSLQSKGGHAAARAVR